MNHNIEPVRRELLEEMARSVQPPPASAPDKGKAVYDVAAFIARHQQLKARPPVPYRGGQKWILEECPFNPGHLASASLFQRANGKPGFKCQHNSCANQHWRDLRALFEPDADQDQDHGFRLGSDALLYIDTDLDGRPRPVYICGRLEITACARDAQSESWGRELEWRDLDGHPHTWALPMSMLAGDGTAYREILHDGGLNIAPGRRARELLTMYIQTSKPEARVRSVGRIGWTSDSYVLPAEVIAPDGAEKLRFQAIHNLEHFYRTAGTLDDWRTNVSLRCIGNSRLLFATSAAFASALLTPLGVEGGGFHLVHQTSVGKTITSIVAGSVIGGGGPRGFVRTWRATANGLEIMAELHNDCLLLLDEIRELADPKEAEAIAYMLANGEGKLRSTRVITARRSLRWRLLFLSSGELPLSEVAASGGRRIKGGAEIRLINVSADAGVGMGIFEDLHGASSAAEFADQLAAAAKQYYGCAFRAFLTQLVADREHYLEQARQIMDKFIKEFLPADAAPEVQRGLRRFALDAAGGELATRMGITDWEEDDAWRAAGTCFKAWLADRGGAGAIDIEAAMAQVRLFFEANGLSRFQPATVQYDSGGNPISERIVSRAGFWRLNQNGGREYLVFPGVFKEEVCRGFSYRQVAAELEKRGWLQRTPPHWTLRVRAPEGNYFFCVRGCILDV
jgi:putative DNA primase/helicase